MQKAPSNPGPDRRGLLLPPQDFVHIPLHTLSSLVYSRYMSTRTTETDTRTYAVSFGFAPYIRIPVADWEAWKDALQEAGTPLEFVGWGNTFSRWTVRNGGTHAAGQHATSDLFVTVSDWPES